MLTPWRAGVKAAGHRCNGAAALCLLLSACAAGPSGAAGYGATVPPSGYGAFLAARYAMSRDDTATAAHDYAQALNADPNNANLVGAGFQAGLLSGSPEALDLAKRMPGNALALMLRGNQAALEGDFNAAQGFYAALPADDIAGLLKPLLLAWTQYGQGNSQAALSSLTGTNAGGMFAPVYGLNAALIADSAGDVTDAGALYAQVNDNQPNLRLAQIEASWLARQGETGQAQAELASLVAAHPDLHYALPGLQAQVGQKVISTPVQGLAEAYLTLAGSLSDPQSAQLRMVLLRFALQLRPDLAAARLLLANAQIETPDPSITPSDTQFRAAVTTLAPVTTADPLYGPVALQEATLLGALNQTDAAMALLKTLLAAAPQDAGLLATTGDLLRNGGQYGAAIPYYTQAIAAVGTPAPAEAWTLFFDRGSCEDQTGDWTAAEPDLTQALALSPDQPYALNYLAYSWALRGEKLDVAHDMLTRALTLDPNDGDVIDSLAYVELRQGRVKTALAHALQAVHLQPDDPEINGHLGDAFWADGEKLQAAYQWQRALGLKPDAKLKAEIEGKMAAHFGPAAP